MGTLTTNKHIPVNNTEKEKASVQVKCNERTVTILKEVIMPMASEKDPFSIAVLDGCHASGKRGLAINIALGGTQEDGRLAIISNSVCTMIVLELCNKEGEIFVNGMADIILNDGEDQFEMHSDTKGVRIMKWSIPAELSIQMVSAIVASMAPAYVQGCGMLTERDIILTKEEEEEDAAQAEPDTEDAGPIPFPGEYKGEPVPTAEQEPEAAGAAQS